MVFSGLSQKNWGTRTVGLLEPVTGYSPVQFSVPFWSYELDLEALAEGFDLESHSHQYLQSLQSEISGFGVCELKT